MQLILFYNYINHFTIFYWKQFFLSDASMVDMHIYKEKNIKNPVFF